MDVALTSYDGQRHPLLNIPNTIMRTALQQQAHILLLTFTIVIATNGPNKLRLLDIRSKVELGSHTRQVVQTRWWDIVRRLAVNEERIPVRTNRQRSWEHVHGDLLALLRCDALGLHIRDNPMEEVRQDGSSWAWSVGVDHDEGVFGGCWVEALFAGDGEGRL
jgi:hypothetical protein